MAEVPERVREEARALMDGMHLAHPHVAYEQEVARALLSAERRGAEAMREKAAWLLLARTRSDANTGHAHAARLIRSLPLPGDPEAKAKRYVVVRDNPETGQKEYLAQGPDHGKEEAKGG